MKRGRDPRLDGDGLGQRKRPPTRTEKGGRRTIRDGLPFDTAGRTRRRSGRAMPLWGSRSTGGSTRLRNFMAHGWPETGWWKGNTSPSPSRPSGKESCRATAPRSTSSSGESTENLAGTTRRPGSTSSGTRTSKNGPKANGKPGLPLKPRSGNCRLNSPEGTMKARDKVDQQRRDRQHQVSVPRGEHHRSEWSCQPAASRRRQETSGGRIATPLPKRRRA